jgi:hypothetical protein
MLVEYPDCDSSQFQARQSGESFLPSKETKMKHFLALFTGTPEAVETSGWNALPEQERKGREQKGMAAWHAWMEQNSDRLIVNGSPVGKTKRVSATGTIDASNAVCGYVVVAAESHQAAGKLFENHPHFAVFPGEAVEIMECLPIPGM